MLPKDFFEHYARDTHLEFFRGEDLPAGVPDRPGIYAWYGKVLVTDSERQSLDQYDSLADVIRRRVFAPLQRQPYDVVLRAALEPHFRGTIRHQVEKQGLPEIPGPAVRGASEAMLRFLSTPLVLSLFSPPIYVGKSVGQPLSTRIDQHLSALRRYQAASEPYLNEQRIALVNGELGIDDADIAVHSFAIEAAARRFPQDRLFLVTYSPPSLTAFDIDLLEFVANHVAFPLCGRR